LSARGKQQRGGLELRITSRIVGGLKLRCAISRWLTLRPSPQDKTRGRRHRDTSDMSVKIVQDIASSAFSDAIDILAIIETVSALGLDQEARLQKIEKAEAVRAADVIWRALLSRLVSVVARHYAPVKPGDLHAEAAFELLKQNATLAAQMPFPIDIAEAQRLWGQCHGGHRLQRVRTIRDKQLAHVGTWPSAVTRPTNNDALEFAQATTRALEKLAHGAGVVGLSLDRQTPAYKQSAERFFAHWDN
jgi:hypothetical protein